MYIKRLYINLNFSVKILLPKRLGPLIRRQPRSRNVYHSSITSLMKMLPAAS